MLLAQLLPFSSLQESQNGEAPSPRPWTEERQRIAGGESEPPLIMILLLFFLLIIIVIVIKTLCDDESFEPALLCCKVWAASLSGVEGSDTPQHLWETTGLFSLVVQQGILARASEPRSLGRLSRLKTLIALTGPGRYTITADAFMLNAWSTSLSKGCTSSLCACPGAHQHLVARSGRRCATGSEGCSPSPGSRSEQLSRFQEPCPLPVRPMRLHA